MSEISNRSIHATQFGSRAVFAALVFALAGACAQEEPLATVAGRSPATDPDRDTGPQCPTFNASYVEEHSACEVDDDCEVIAVRTRCSSFRAYGVASASVEPFLECAPMLEGCAEDKGKGRAQDGRNVADSVALSDVHARCVEGACVARVESRTCGSSDKVCAADELCVSWLNPMGAVEYACAPNPCLGKPLDCSCAAPICDGKDGQLRTCQFESIEEADVYCKVERR